MLSRKALLRYIGLSCFSLLLAALVYVIDIFLFPTLLPALTQGDLLFFEGLLFVIFGLFFLVTKGYREPMVGFKQRTVYGAPSLSMRTTITPSIVHIALVLIVTGALLILFSFSP